MKTIDILNGKCKCEKCGSNRLVISRGHRTMVVCIDCDHKVKKVKGGTPE